MVPAMDTYMKSSPALSQTSDSEVRGKGKKTKNMAKREQMQLHGRRMIAEDTQQFVC